VREFFSLIGALLQCRFLDKVFTLDIFKNIVSSQSQFKKLGGVIRDGFVVTSIVPGERVEVKGQYQGKAASVTGSKLAICPGPWAKKVIEPLLEKSITNFIKKYTR